MKKSSFTGFRRLSVTLSLSLLSLAGLLLILNAHCHPVLADPGELFVMPGTSGACTQSDPCALGTAVNSALNGNTIYVAQGTYTGTGSAVVTFTHSITLYGGWDGSPEGNIVRDPNTHITTLDGEQLRRVVHISGPITPTVDGFTIIRGNATGLAGTPYNQHVGGGIYSVDASPIIINNVISDNLGSSSPDTYGRGGGIMLANASSTALISGNLIISNTASTARSGYGGGISTYQSDATIQFNLVLSNTGSTVNYGSGGGIYLNRSNSRLLANTIRGNVASPVSASGGGIALESSPALIEGNLIQGNSAAAQSGFSSAGGIRINNSNATLLRNRVLSNTAQVGGGIRIFRGDFVTLTNNIIASNHVTDHAGGVLIEGLDQDTILQGTLIHNTIAENDLEGVYLENAQVTLTNNIIVNHEVAIAASANSTATAAYSLFFANEGDTGGAGTITSTHAITGLDPEFVNPFAWDFHLELNSPAINVGINTGIAVDIDNESRPFGPLPDIGADEVRLLRVYLPLVVRD